MFKRILVLLICSLPLLSFAEAPQIPQSGGEPQFEEEPQAGEAPQAEDAPQAGEAPQDNQAQEASQVAELKQKALDEIAAAVAKAGNAVAISYLEDNTAKYLTGGELGLVFQGRYTIDKCEKVLSPNPPYHYDHICTEVFSEEFPYNYFRGESQHAATELFALPFTYSLKTSIRTKVSPNGKGLRSYIGTTEDEPHDPINSELIGDRIPIKKFAQRGKFFLNIDGTAHFTIYSYIRTKFETLKEVSILSSNDRVTSGELTLSRLGPGIDQTDIKITLPIEGNKSTQAITDIITGDYFAKLSNAFCGCPYTLSEDHVIDTYKGEGSDKATFNLPELVDATVKGRLVAKNLAGEFIPVKNTELMLKPACKEADECMGQVEKVKTDSDGEFEFEEVPKGGYEIFHRKLNLKSVLNCEAATTQMDVGEVEIELDPIYTVDVRYSSPNHFFLSAAHVQWKHVTIDPVENDEWVLFAGKFGLDGFPEDTESYPITVPFKTAYPNAPYSEIIWGEAMLMNDEINSELKSIKTGPYTTNGCKVYEDPWLSLNYRNKSEAIPPFGSIPKGHHLELRVPIECYFKMIDLPPGVNGGMPHHPAAPTNKSAESTFWVNPNTPLDYGESHFSQFKLTVIPDAVIKALTEGKDTQFTLTREGGERLVIKFIREEFPYDDKDDKKAADDFDKEFESADNFDSEFDTKSDFDKEFESKDEDSNSENNKMSPPDVGDGASPINFMLDLFSDFFSK